MPSSKKCKPIEHFEELLPIVSKIAIFGGFTDAQLKEIFKLLKKVSYNEGEFIFRQGDEPSSIYIIKSGEVKIVVDRPDISLELMDFFAGDCLGETSVIGIQSHSVCAVTIKSTELIVLEKAALFSLFETDKELFGLLILNIARETARRLHKMDETMINYLLSSRHKKQD